MALIVVPSDKRVAKMEDIDQAMVRAQTLLQKKMPTDPDAHEERFKFFTETALKAPFLSLDKSETDRQTWSNKKMSVKDVLKTILPSVIMAAIESKTSALQSIIDGSAKISGFTSFWYSHAEDDKHVAQFCINRIPQWGVSRFEIYFVEIKASFSSSAVFGIASTSNFMEARFCLQQYSVSTTFLLEEMRLKPEEVKEEMDNWDAATKFLCNN